MILIFQPGPPTSFPCSCVFYLFSPVDYGCQAPILFWAFISNQAGIQILLQSTQPERMAAAGLCWWLYKLKVRIAPYIFKLIICGQKKKQCNMRPKFTAILADYSAHWRNQHLVLGSLNNFLVACGNLASKHRYFIRYLFSFPPFYVFHFEIIPFFLLSQAVIVVAPRDGADPATEPMARCWTHRLDPSGVAWFAIFILEQKVSTCRNECAATYIVLLSFKFK